MRNFRTRRIFIFTSCILGLAQCKKSYEPMSEILYDKPLDEIRGKISGDWIAVYGKGGICGTCVQPYNGIFWTIKADDSIRILTPKGVTTNEKIKWVKDFGSYTNGDSTFVMQFNDLLGYPYRYVVDRIENDTLVLHDNSADAVFYHFTRN